MKRVYIDNNYLVVQNEDFSYDFMKPARDVTASVGDGFLVLKYNDNAYSYYRIAVNLTADALNVPYTEDTLRAMMFSSTGSVGGGGGGGGGDASEAKQNEMIALLRTLTLRTSIIDLLRSQDDYIPTIAWLDIGTEDQRPSTITHSSATLGAGATIVETIVWAGSAGNFYPVNPGQLS
ncbi:hypothetical protein [Aquimarina algiphila]|uniref:Uncharacterized protein n=1 Tax=Aquimarina algiphila TaxID=2047982 RepID=A0A554VRL4_9FLAO|nr:hypothetical protein [Aquimarina algiphila]TSE11297.1 hypothetical protein FOF46_01315 [Aquimarina algiphila]